MRNKSWKHFTLAKLKNCLCKACLSAGKPDHGEEKIRTS